MRQEEKELLGRIGRIGGEEKKGEETSQAVKEKAAGRERLVGRGGEKLLERREAEVKAVWEGGMEVWEESMGVWEESMGVWEESMKVWEEDCKGKGKKGILFHGQPRFLQLPEKDLG